MKYETFEKSILAIKKFEELNDRVYDATDHAISLFEMDDIITLETTILNLLEEEFDDKENDWIGYYIYELHFGEDYHDGCITDENGFNVKMKTIKDLYTVLMDNLDGNHEVNNQPEKEEDNRMPELEDGMYIRFVDGEVALILGDKLIFEDGSFGNKYKVLNINTDKSVWDYTIKEIYKFENNHVDRCYKGCTDKYKIWERKE